MPCGENEKMIDSVMPKYELPNMEKGFNDVPHDGSTKPCFILEHGCHSKSDMLKCLRCSRFRHSPWGDLY
jgi:hypothetical protein